jgi:SpoVK/Ycf46/Vps4 family AAA+-type ATPase
MAKLQRWTRDEILSFSWTPFESVEKLALPPFLKSRIELTATSFRDGREAYHSVKLSWRRGIFFYGASGTGKTAASRAIARALDWDHLTIPAHEILDSHLLEHALADAVAKNERVIVLEDVDQMVERMEPEVFFTLLDHAMERAEGSFWIATSRHPEKAPKTQLVRPGRFDESIRLDLPGAPLRKEILMNDFVVPFFSTLSEDEEKTLTALVEETEGLSFSHFEEMRQIAARLKLEGRESEFWETIHGYIQDQIIAGDRWGGISDATTDLNERVRHIDSRVLSAALDMTDVFRALLDKTLGDAAEKSRQAQNEEGLRKG